jgi:hypothetical protein
LFRHSDFVIRHLEADKQPTNGESLTPARDLRPAMTGPCPYHKENCHGGRLHAGEVL